MQQSACICSRPSACPVPRDKHVPRQGGMHYLDAGFLPYTVDCWSTADSGSCVYGAVVYERTSARASVGIPVFAGRSAHVSPAI